MKTITGNTYPVRQQLKDLGGRWNAAAQGWDVPDEAAGKAAEIVAAAGPAQDRGRFRAGSRSNSFRFSSGATMYQNKRGRCIDAPCCGCCS